MSYRVLVVEDEPEMQVILRDNLEYEGFDVLQASTAEDGLRLALSHACDLVLLDVMLPRMSGYEMCRRLRTATQMTPIIMVTARNAEIDRVAGLELGADDYISKPFGVRELIARIRVQLRRQSQAAAAQDDELRIGNVLINWRTRQARTAQGAIELSAKEFDLLEYLRDHAGRVVTREELLAAVWGYGDMPLTRTVDNFVAKLRKKIEPAPHKPRHILTAHGAGYRFVI